MRYAQIKAGQKLHLVFELPGERVSWPICGKRFKGGYRMTINVPLAHACHNCLRVTPERILQLRQELAKTLDPIEMVK